MSRLDPKIENNPCRIIISCNGVEYFIYNRTPIYDYWAKQLSKLDSDSQPARYEFSTVAKVSKESKNKKDSSKYSDLYENTWRKILPIEFNLGKGSIVIGNREMPSILVVDWSMGSGTYSCKKSKSSLDCGKYVFDITFEKPKLQLRTNYDFKEGALMTLPSMPSNIFMRWAFKAYLFIVNKRVREKFADPGDNADQQRWEGLQPFMENGSNQLQEALLFQEYAKVTSVIVSDKLSVCYYSDDAGIIPSRPVFSLAEIKTVDDFDLANGDYSPEWGLNLDFNDSIVHYGPWADRQRPFIQNFFYPFVYRNFPQTPFPKVGEKREFCRMDLDINFHGETTWRIPAREQSKDWKFQEKQKADIAEEKNDSAKSPNEKGEKISSRPYAWVDFKFDEGANFTMSIPMLFKDVGYQMDLKFGAPKLQILTSLNYAPLAIVERSDFYLYMDSPLAWNDMHTWDVDISFDKASIYILRDHTSLLSDLLNDWNDRPSGDVEHFIPYDYNIRMNFKDNRILFCTNQENVISQPNDNQDNSFIVINCPNMTNEINMLFDKFEPIMYEYLVSFELSEPWFSFEPPNCSTLGTFLNEESKFIGNSTRMNFEFLLRYYHGSLTEKIERDAIILNSEFENLRLIMHGFVADAFSNLSNNYFGQHINFMTLDEYRDRLQNGHKKKEDTPNDDQITSPPIDYISFLEINDLDLILPEYLFEEGNSFSVKFDSLRLENHMTDDFSNIIMDISQYKIFGAERNSTNASPYKFEHGGYFFGDESHCEIMSLYGPAPYYEVYTSSIIAHVGKISGEASVDFLSSAISFYNSFIHQWNDQDGKLNSEPDKNRIHKDLALNFILAKFDPIKITIWCEQNYAIDFNLVNGALVDFDNVVDHHYAQRLGIELPNFLLQVMEMDFENSTVDRKCFREVSRIQSGFFNSYYVGSNEHARKKEMQQNFLMEQDRQTNRISYIYREKYLDEALINAYKKSSRDHRVFRPPFEIPKLKLLDDRIYSNFRRDEQDYENFQTISYPRWEEFKRSLLSYSPPENLDRNVVWTVDQSKTKSVNFSGLPKFILIPGKIFDASENERYLSPYFQPSESADNIFDRPKNAQRKVRVYSPDEMAHFITNDVLQQFVGVEFRREIDIMLSYPLIHVIERFARHIIYPEILSTQKCIEEIYVKFMRELMQNEEKRKANNFLVHIPYINIKIIGNSGSPQKLTSFRDGILEDTIQINAVISNLKFSLLHEKLRKNFYTCSIDSASVYLRSAMQLNREKIPFAASDSATLTNIILSYSHSFEETSSQLFSDFEELSGVISENSIYKAIFEGLIWLEKIKSCFKIRKQIENWKKYQTAKQFSELASKSNDNDISDPVFMNRPTNLWRLNSKSYQNSDDWKLLTRIMQIFQSDSFKNGMEHFDVNEILDVNNELYNAFYSNFKEVMSQWRPWDIDDISKSTIAKSIFHFYESDESFCDSVVVVFNTGNISVDIIHDRATAHSSFNLSPAKAALKVQNWKSFSMARNVKVSTVYRLRAEYCEVSLAEEISLLLNRSSEYQRLMKCHLPGLSQKENIVPFKIYGISCIERLVIKFKFGGFSGKLFGFNMRHSLGHELAGYASENLNTISSQEFGFQQVLMKLNLSTEGIVGSMDMRGFTGFYCNSPSINNSSLMVDLNSFGIDVPGSAIKLYLYTINHELINLFGPVVKNESVQSYSNYELTNAQNESKNEHSFRVSFKIGEGTVRASLLPSLRIQYGIYGITSIIDYFTSSDCSLSVEYELETVRQNLIFFLGENSRAKIKASKPSSLSIPKMLLAGSYNSKKADKNSLDMKIIFSMVELSMGVEDLDKFITFQLVVSSEIRDAQQIISNNQSNKIIKNSDKNTESYLNYAINLEIDGVRLNLEAPFSSIHLQIDNLGSQVKQSSGKIIWGINIPKVFLSLIRNDIDRYIGKTTCIGQLESKVCISNDKQSHNAPLSIICKVDPVICSLDESALTEIIKFFSHYQNELELRNQHKKQQLKNLRADANEFLERIGVLSSSSSIESSDESMNDEGSISYSSDFRLQIKINSAVLSMRLADDQKSSGNIFGKDPSHSCIFSIKKSDFLMHAGSAEASVIDSSIKFIQHSSENNEFVPAEGGIRFPVINIHNQFDRSGSSIHCIFIPTYALEIQKTVIVAWTKLLRNIEELNSIDFSGSAEKEVFGSHDDATFSKMKFTFTIGDGKITLKVPRNFETSTFDANLEKSKPSFDTPMRQPLDGKDSGTLSPISPAFRHTYMANQQHKDHGTRFSMMNRSDSVKKLDPNITCQFGFPKFRFTTELSKQDMPGGNLMVTFILSTSPIKNRIKPEILIILRTFMEAGDRNQPLFNDDDDDVTASASNKERKSFSSSMHQNRQKQNYEYEDNFLSKQYEKSQNHSKLAPSSKLSVKESPTDSKHHRHHHHHSRNNSNHDKSNRSNENNKPPAAKGKLIIRGVVDVSTIELCLTCSADTKVENMIQLGSAKMSLNIESDFQKLNFIDCIMNAKDIEYHLRHQYASDECFNLSIDSIDTGICRFLNSNGRNIVTTNKKSSLSVDKSATSIITNIEKINGKFNIRQLQDLLVAYDQWGYPIFSLIMDTNIIGNSTNSLGFGNSVLKNGENINSATTGYASQYFTSEKIPAVNSRPNFANSNESMTKFLLKINQIRMLVDLTQAIGKFRFEFVDTIVKSDSRHDHRPRNLSKQMVCLRSEYIDIQSEGRLSGRVVSMNNAEFKYFNNFRSEKPLFKANEPPAQLSETNWIGSIARFQCLLEYNMERIAIVDGGPLKISRLERMRNRKNFSRGTQHHNYPTDYTIDGSYWQNLGLIIKDWILPSALRYRSKIFQEIQCLPQPTINSPLKIHVCVYGFHGIVSKTTLPCIMILQDKLVAIVDEKLAAFDKLKSSETIPSDLIGHLKSRRTPSRSNQNDGYQGMLDQKNPPNKFSSSSSRVDSNIYSPAIFGSALTGSDEAFDDEDGAYGFSKPNHPSKQTKSRNFKHSSADIESEITENYPNSEEPLITRLIGELCIDIGMAEPEGYGFDDHLITKQSKSPEAYAYHENESISDIFADEYDADSSKRQQKKPLSPSVDQLGSENRSAHTLTTKSPNEIPRSDHQYSSSSDNSSAEDQFDSFSDDESEQFISSSDVSSNSSNDDDNDRRQQIGRTTGLTSNLNESNAPSYRKYKNCVELNLFKDQFVDASQQDCVQIALIGVPLAPKPMRRQSSNSNNGARSRIIKQGRETRNYQGSKMDGAIQSLEKQEKSMPDNGNSQKIKLQTKNNNFQGNQHVHFNSGNNNNDDGDDDDSNHGKTDYNHSYRSSPRKASVPKNQSKTNGKTGPPMLRVGLKLWQIKLAATSTANDAKTLVIYRKDFELEFSQKTVIKKCISSATDARNAASSSSPLDNDDAVTIDKNQPESPLQNQVKTIPSSRTGYQISTTQQITTDSPSNMKENGDDSSDNYDDINQKQQHYSPPLETINHSYTNLKSPTLKANDRQTSSNQIKTLIDQINQRSSKVILDLPATKIIMDSYSMEPGKMWMAEGILRQVDTHNDDHIKLTPATIFFQFSTEFQDSIDLNLNFKFLKFLQDLASDYGQELKQTMQELQHEIRITSNYNEEKGNIKASTAGEKLLIESNGEETLKQTNANDKLTPQQYIPLQPMQFDPQLKMIEGVLASKDLMKWLGLNKQTVPIKLYEWIVEPMKEWIGQE